MNDQTSAIGQTFDVIVIGSGFGGAAVACRLAQAGQNVAILERGKRYPLGRGDFTETGHGVDTPRYGHFKIDQGTGMNVIRGIGVGGGSLHYFGVKLRTPADIFETSRWPTVITRELLDPYYDLAGDMLAASPVQPNPVYGLPFKGQAFINAARSCRRCQDDPKWVPIAVNSGPDPIPTPSGVAQTRCVFCGDCLVGCPPSETFEGNVNARALLTMNYLAVAENHGATIFPQHMVKQVIQTADGFEVIVAVDIVDGDPKSVGRVSATQVVLAAGTMGSTEILLKSKSLQPKLSTKLGLEFSGNGDFLIAKTKETSMDMQPKSGPTITAGADFSTAQNRIYIEELGAIPVLGSLLGLEKGEVSLHGRYQLRYLGMGTDAANGVLSLRDREIHLNWDPTDSLPLYNDIIAALREMSQQLNGRYANPRGYNPETGTGLTTAHPLGGCVMGDTIDSGVVNPQGEVYGVPGLFVADGAIIPSALAVNPSFTISALAERVAFWMINGRDMTANDPDTPANT